jgi:secretion-regulating guanine nucleotide exchange factor
VILIVLIDFLEIINFRDAEVQRLDAKVIAPLSQYAMICKHAREDVKNTFAARDREFTRRRHLDKVRERNPRNRQMIVSL